MPQREGSLEMVVMLTLSGSGAIIIDDGMGGLIPGGGPGGGLGRGQDPGGGEPDGPSTRRNVIDLFTMLDSSGW